MEETSQGLQKDAGFLL